MTISKLCSAHVNIAVKLHVDAIKTSIAYLKNKLERLLSDEDIVRLSNGYGVKLEISSSLYNMLNYRMNEYFLREEYLKKQYDYFSDIEIRDGKYRHVFVLDPLAGDPETGYLDKLIDVIDNDHNDYQFDHNLNQCNPDDEIGKLSNDEINANIRELIADINSYVPNKYNSVGWDIMLAVSKDVYDGVRLAYREKYVEQLFDKIGYDFEVRITDNYGHIMYVISQGLDRYPDYVYER